MDSNGTNKKLITADADGEDKIRVLPQNILSHILSCLPTKEAVRTSVLSTKWKYFWTLITHLNFDDSLPCLDMIGEQSFVNFVNRVILHLESLNIHSFTLSLSKKYDPDLVNAWISAILGHGVQKLHIHYLELFVFPSSLFKCSFLVELELTVKCDLRVSSYNCLSNLQILKLFGIDFAGSGLAQSKDVVLDLPVLKNSAIKILALHLTKFSYSGNLNVDIILSDPLSIISVSFKVSEVDESNMYPAGIKLCMLLRGFNRVEFLSLEQMTVQVLVHAVDCISTLPLFERLICLELELGTSLQCQEILGNLLHKSPMLEKLVFLSGTSSFDENFSTLMGVCCSLPSCLTDIEFVDDPTSVWLTLI